MERVKKIQYPAPLPEEPVIPRLAKMLVPAPYTAPAKKAKGVRSGPHRKGATDASSADKTRSSVAEDDDDEEEEKEEESDSPPDGGRRKRAASTVLETEAPKKGKGQLAGSSVSLLATASHTAEVSGLQQRLEQAEEELGRARRQLQEKQGM
nr:uncharacterized protein LOC123496868 [Aegilops tauschii subsp. strangulata]